MPIVADLSMLDSRALSERLRSLAGDERSIQADFLLHLDALDRRRGYAELGYPSLWEYCLRALHLREGAAGRRIGAMRVLRRYPVLVDALRDGRLSLSTLRVLGPVLTAENVLAVTAQAAFRTKAETDAIAASVKPRAAPAQGLRRLTPVQMGPLVLAEQSVLTESAQTRVEGPALPTPTHAVADTAAPPTTSPFANVPMSGARPCQALALQNETDPSSALALGAPPPRRPATAELRAVADAQWSLRVTLDAEAKEDLETLTALLAHKVPSRNLAAVLAEALRCAVEKHGVRRGALVPARRKSAAEPKKAPGGPSPGRRPTIPAEVRRQVWERDGGMCSFTASDGTRCGTRWQLELDHVVPFARGGEPTVTNLRLRCRTHNVHHAERVFGREHMERFRRAGAAAVEAAPRISR